MTGNITRTCGLNNQWLPAKIYCIREQIDMVFTEVCSTCLFKNCCQFLFQIIGLTESLSNLTLTEQINKTDSIVTTLANITVPAEESQFPQELRTIVNIISNINKYLKIQIINLSYVII